MSREGFELLFDAYPDDRDVQLLRDAVQEAITTDLTELRFYLMRLTSKDGCVDAVISGMEHVIRDLQMPALHDVPAGAVIKVVVIRHELASAGVAYCRQGKGYHWTGWWWRRNRQTAGELRAYYEAVLKAARDLITWYESIQPVEEKSTTG